MRELTRDMQIDVSSDACIRAGKSKSFNERISFFREHMRLMPKVPGVYKMLGENDKIIYIGKAKNLRNRVASYFTSYHTRLVTQILVTKILALDYVVTMTEKEALILENILIKRHQPFFNIDLKDNKTYPYLWLTTHEKFPRLLKTRQLGTRGTYFGPYTDVKRVNIFLDMVQTLFPLKKCKQTRFPKGFKPCLYYHIGKCLDYCTGNVTQETVDKINKEIKNLLRGKLQDIITKLEVKMREASAALHYERAMAIHGAIEKLTGLNAEQAISILRKDDFDVFHYNVAEGWLIIAVLLFREGKMINKEVFQFQHALWQDKILSDPAAAEEESAPDKEEGQGNERVKYNSSEGLQFIIEAFSQFLFEYYQRNNDQISHIVIPEDLHTFRGAKELLRSSVREALALRTSMEDVPVEVIEGHEVLAEKKMPVSELQEEEGDTAMTELSPASTFAMDVRAQDDYDRRKLAVKPRKAYNEFYIRGKNSKLASSTDSGMSEAETVQSSQGETSPRVPRLITGLRGDNKRFLRLAKANADKSFYHLRYKNEKQQKLHLLREALKLDKLPEVIDAFDVANTADQGIAAACVRFVKGRPDKQQYRLFNIRLTQRQNDFLSIAEAVYRRYKRLVLEKGVLPNLILIDGGRGQLHAAEKSLRELKLEKIALISLAKQEELVFIKNKKEPVRLEETDEALRLLVAIRDEVHRFVNKHHQKIRDKDMLRSQFEKLRGFGPRKIEVLLTHFASLEDLKLASREDVTALPYIGSKDYDLLIDFFKHEETFVRVLYSSEAAEEDL